MENPPVKSIIAVAALLCAFAADAQTLADVKKRGALRIGYSETSVPFSFKDKDGQPSGYSVELCKRVATAITTKSGAAVKVEWVPLTPATRLDAVATGKVDMECSTATVTLSRRETVDFSLPIFVDAATVMSRGTAAKALSDLQGKKIAVAEGTTTVAALEGGLAKRFIKAEIVKTKTVAEGFDLLKEGKVDALASDRTALVGTFLRGGGAEGLGVLSEDLSYEPYAIVLPRGDWALRLAVNTGLAEVFRSGEIMKVFDRWFTPIGMRPGLLLGSTYALGALRE